MTLKKYLFAMSFLTAICWLVVAFIVSMVNPDTTNWLGIALFYVSFFLAASGMAAILGFLLRFVIMKKELEFNLVKIAFRQSFLLGLFLVITLFLLAEHLFTWINIVLLVIVFAIIELFFINYKQSR
jgi:hypothetical protein